MEVSKKTNCLLFIESMIKFADIGTSQSEKHNILIYREISIRMYLMLSVVLSQPKEHHPKTKYFTQSCDVQY